MVTLNASLGGTGCDMAGCCRPFHDVGGDFFDVFPLADGKPAIAVADVSGNGYTAGEVARSAQDSLRQSASTTRDMPRLVERLNQEMEATTNSDMFMTFFMLVLERESGLVVKYLNAGHEPGLLFRCSTQEVVDLSSTCFPVGMMSRLGSVEPQTVVMEPGDVLLLYTDGLSEMQNKDMSDMFRHEHLKTSLVQHAAKTPRDLIASILDDAREFAGGAPAEDDLTIVVLKAK